MVYNVFTFEFSENKQTLIECKYSFSNKNHLFKLTPHLSSELAVTPTEANKDDGGEVAFVCEATVASTVGLVWRNGDEAIDIVADKVAFTTPPYDDESGTISSTLTMSNLVTTDSSAEIGCYDNSALDLSSVVTLTVVGELMFLDIIACVNVSYFINIKTQFYQR